MNMSIDALAVIDCAAETLVRMKGAGANPRLVNVQRDALIKARAAVAELIDASTEMLRVERTQGVTCEEFESAVEALDAALTRVQGGAA